VAANAAAIRGKRISASVSPLQAEAGVPIAEAAANAAAEVIRAENAENGPAAIMTIVTSVIKMTVIMERRDLQNTLHQGHPSTISIDFKINLI